MEHFQEQLLKCKDARMGIVGEVLNSMRVIKYYAWEGKFTDKVCIRTASPSQAYSALLLSQRQG